MGNPAIADLADYITLWDVVVFFGVPLILLMLAFIQRRRRSRRSRSHTSM